MAHWKCLLVVCVLMLLTSSLAAPAKKRKRQATGGWRPAATPAPQQASGEQYNTDSKPWSAEIPPTADEQPDQEDPYVEPQRDIDCRYDPQYCDPNYDLYSPEDAPQPEYPTDKKK